MPLFVLESIKYFVRMFSVASEFQDNLLKQTTERMMATHIKFRDTRQKVAAFQDKVSQVT